MIEDLTITEQINLDVNANNKIVKASSELDKRADSLVAQIVEETDSKEIKDLLQQFNLNHTKKQIVRSAVFDQLMDHITDQMQERITKRGDQFSNKDLLDYLNTINASIDKTQKQIQEVDAIPVIQVTQQTNNILFADSLDRESRERITNAIQLFKQQLKEKVENNSEIVDISNSDDVYNNDDSTDKNDEEIVEETDSLDNLFEEESEED